MIPLEPSVAVAAATFVGLCIGSFLNVVIHRLPLMMEREWQEQCAEIQATELPEAPPFNLSAPRSHCPVCKHQITAWQNIPVISYLLLKGKCAKCQTKISIRYPLIEALTAVLSAYTAWHFGPTLATVAALGLLWSLIALTFIDFDTQYLPDSITLPLLWAGLLFNLRGGFTSLETAVIGAAAGYIILWSVYQAYKIVTGKIGMGHGDFKLLAALGAWLGWTMLPAIILLSSLVGAIVGIVLIVLTRRGKDIPIPFGPYLAAAGLLALFWGKQINQVYLGVIT